MQAHSSAHRRLSTVSLADGGFVDKLKHKIFGRPALGQQQAAPAARAASSASEPQPDPKADPKASARVRLGGLNLDAIRRREQEAGLKDGGVVPRTGRIRGPGTGTSDSIPARMPVGSFVVPADSTEELADVQVSNGEAAIAPEAVQRIGAAALLAMRDSTHKPVPIPRRRSARQRLAGGGEVEEQKQNSFGDAAAAARDSGVTQLQAPPPPASPPASNPPAASPLPAASEGAAPPPSMAATAPTTSAGDAPGGRANSFGDAAAARSDSSVSQIPTSGYPTAPDGNRVDSTEAGRNAHNIMMALPGAAGAVGAGAQAVASMRGIASAALGGTGLANAAGEAAAAPAQPAPGAGAAGAALPAGDSAAGAGRGAAADPRSLAPPGWTPPNAEQQVAAGVGGVAPGPNPENKQVMGTLSNNIVRQGNSYSSGDGGPITAGATINGQEGRGAISVVPGAPGGGGPSSRTENFLPEGHQPQVYRQAPGTDWQSRQELKNAETGASSIVPSEARRQDQLKAHALRGIRQQGERNQGEADVAGIQAEAQKAAETMRSRTQQAGLQLAAQNNAATQSMAERRLGLDANAAGLDARAKMNTLGAQEAVLNAKTPQAQSSAAAKLRAMSGQADKQSPSPVVVNGARRSDGSSDAQAVFSNGQWLKPPETSFTPRRVGATSTVNGRTAVWDGSKWTPR